MQESSQSHIPLRTIALFLLFLHAFQSDIHAEDKKQLTLGAVGYGQELEAAVSQLADFLNRNAELGEYEIRKTPALLSYENAIAFTNEKQLDIVLLTPAAYIKAKRSGSENSLKPIAITLTEKRRSCYYRGKILFNPKTVSKETLELLKPKRKRRKPKIALLAPFSTSGYLFPMEVFHREGFLDGTKKGIASIEGKFTVIRSISHGDSLDKFFSSEVDIAPIYEGELGIYLEEAKHLRRAKAWMKRYRIGAAIMAPSAEDIEKTVLKECVWKETDEIPSDVIVVRTDLPSHNERLATGLRESLAKLDNELKQIDDYLEKHSENLATLDDEELLSLGIQASIALVKSLGKREIYGFMTEGDLGGKYKDVERVYENYRDKAAEKEWGVSAQKVVTDIAYDIKFKRWLDPSYKPRIAVVLSGGGASGAYQAGVLTELRRALGEFRETMSSNEPKLADHLRIQLLVGTSVGAINAGAVSLALPPPSGQKTHARSATSAEADALRALWSSITTNKVLGANELLGGCKFYLLKMFSQYRGPAIALLAAALLIQAYGFIALAASLSRLTKRARVVVLLACLAAAFVWLLIHDTTTATILLVLAALFACLIYMQIRECQNVVIWSGVFIVLGLIFVFSPLFTADFHFPALWLGALIIAVSSIYLITHWRLGEETRPGEHNLAETFQQRFPKLSQALRYTRTLSIIMLFVIAPFQIVELLLEDHGFFDPTMLKRTVADNYWSVMTGTGLKGERSDLSEVSKSIAEDIQTDIVITATDFTRYEEGVQPREVYFYKSEVAPNSSESVNPPRWISIEKNKDKFLAMVVASASIFPGFPPHIIKDVVTETCEGDEKKESFELIDGGYLHNVPVHAAIQLGRRTLS